MGIYARATNKDRFNNTWQLNVYDSTYSASINNVICGKGGFELTVDGFNDEVYFEPLVNTSIRVPIYSQSSTDAVQALFNDLALAKENQYFLTVLINGSLWWAGSLIPDAIESLDEYPYELNLQFTSGLNRLEGFKCPWYATYPNSEITVLEAVRLCLMELQLDQFWGTNDTYISVASSIYEEQVGTSARLLEYTRVPVISMFEDYEKRTLKDCKQVIIDLLKPFGMSIRLTKGRWVIQHIQSYTTPTTTYYNYRKAGTYINSTSPTNDITIDNTTNFPLNALTNSYKPNYKEVAIACNLDSYFDYRRLTYLGSDFSFTRHYNYSTLKDILSFEASLVRPNTVYSIRVSFFFIRLEFDIRIGQYYLRRNLTNDAFDWVTSPPAEKPFFDIESTSQIVNIQGSLVIPPVFTDVTSSTMTFNVFARENLFQRCAFIIKIKIKPEALQETQYRTYNNILNAASYVTEQEVVYADLAMNSSAGTIQVFDSPNWKFSQTWSDGSLTGKKLNELISIKASEFQRSPRLLVQGTFIIDGFDLSKRLVWRSSDYLFLNGTFTCENGEWNGYWLELLYQSGDLTSDSNNPYRNNVQVIRDDGDLTARNLNDLANQVGGVVINIDNILQRLRQVEVVTQANVGVWLLQNLEGIPNSASVGEEFVLKAEVLTDGKTKMKWE